MRLDDRMLRGMNMLGRVLVLRRIAAADVSTGHAQSQVDPIVAHLEALFATLGMRLHISNLAGVFAVFHFRLTCFYLE
jgi:hypothetical protein